MAKMKRGKDGRGGSVFVDILHMQAEVQVEVQAEVEEAEVGEAYRCLLICFIDLQ